MHVAHCHSQTNYLHVPLRWTSYICDVCGKSHSRWTISDPSTLQAYFRQAGAPYLPHFRTVNTRNIRAVFHRYNAKHNKGFLPDEDIPKTEQRGAEDDNCLDEDTGLDPRGASGSSDAGVALKVRFLEDDCGDADGDGINADEVLGEEGTSPAGEKTAKVEGDRSEHTSGCLGPEIWDDASRKAMCCCQYRSLGTMEL